MSDIHWTCCCGCRRTPETIKYSFSKRLLVAVSVVIIIAMCLNPAEAQPVEHRRRHQRTRQSDIAQLTKENLSLKRPNPSVDHYKNATRKIKHKLHNTKRFFEQDKKVLRNETRDYRDGMPVWLPSVNFVDIHFHDYKSPRKSGKSVTERKFTYLMPKLYKTLREYEVIFKLLLNVQIKVTDEPFNNYLAIRRKFMRDTLDKLSSTIDEINFNMAAVNMVPPAFDKNRMKLEALQRQVDATQCLKNDHIAFRGYGNLLSNWYAEFRCPLNKKTDRKCAAFHVKMTEKRDRKRRTRNMSIS